MKKYNRPHFNIPTLLIGLLLSGCVPKLTDADLVGLWVESPCPKPQKTECASIIFFDDGRFELNNGPAEFFSPTLFRSTNPIINDDGVYSLSEKHDPLGGQELELWFNPEDSQRILGSSYTMIMWTLKGEKQVKLFTWDGDESNNIKFIKER